MHAKIAKARTMFYVFLLMGYIETLQSRFQHAHNSLNAFVIKCTYLMIFLYGGGGKNIFPL